MRACKVVESISFLFFLQHDTYINYIKFHFTGLSSYIALHHLLTVLLRYNWYLCFFHCSTYTTYNVIMHTYLEAHHLHINTKKEKLIHKKLKVTKVKKAKLWVGLIRVRAWEKKPKSTTFSKNWFSDQHKESKIKPASRLTFGARPETI